MSEEIKNENAETPIETSLEDIVEEISATETVAEATAEETPKEETATAESVVIPPETAKTAETVKASKPTKKELWQAKMAAEKEAERNRTSGKKMNKGLKYCCVTPLIVLVVIVALLGAAVLTVLNLTPNQMSFGDIEFAEGITLNSLGFGDMKIKEIYAVYKGFVNPDESQIVTNPITAADKTAVDAAFSGAELPRKENGDIDYAKIVASGEPVYYDKEYLIVYKDTNLAYIINTAVTQNNELFEERDDLKALRDMDINIVEVSITDAGGSKQMRAILKMDLSSIKDVIVQNMAESAGSGTANFLADRIPSEIYLTSVNRVSADENGKMTTVSASVKINNIDNEVLTNAIFDAISQTVESNTGKENGEDSKATVNNAVGSLLATLISDLGRIGTATTDGDNVVTGNVSFGGVGISDGQVSVITYVKGE